MKHTSSHLFIWVWVRHQTTRNPLLTVLHMVLFLQLQKTTTIHQAGLKTKFYKTTDASEKEKKNTSSKSQTHRSFVEAFVLKHALKLSSDITTESSQMWQNSWGFDLYYIFPVPIYRIKMFPKNTPILWDLIQLGKNKVSCSLWEVSGIFPLRGKIIRDCRALGKVWSIVLRGKEDFVAFWHIFLSNINSSLSFKHQTCQWCELILMSKTVNTKVSFQNMISWFKEKKGYPK